jgi:hypothetical protein
MNATLYCVFSALSLVACVSEVPGAQSAASASEAAQPAPDAVAPVASHLERHVGPMRFAGSGAPGYAVARREKDAIAIWTEGPDGSPLGEPTRIRARHVIGDVSVAVSGESALVAWAQGEPTGCTSLFGVVWRSGESPSEVRRLAAPCNEEKSARSPNAVGAKDGQFVVLYTDLGVWSSSLASVTVSN